MECQATSSLTLTQSEPLPTACESPRVVWPAQELGPAQRKDLAIQILAGASSVTELAREYRVSRKFLYRQLDTASLALSGAFEPSQPSPDVLFYLPVTKAWLCQLVLALVLICRSPYRGVVVLLRDLFDYRLSLGSVHNIVHSHVTAARGINRDYDLSAIRVGAHDEIFQSQLPVLVGVDTASTFCYLLSPEGHRDAETWGVRLLELVDRGFAPQAVVADAGCGLRAGHALALPEVPCRGDIFHALRELLELAGYLENRAYEAIKVADRRHRQLAGARRYDRRVRVKSIAAAAQRASRADADSDAMIALSDQVSLLIGWLRHDVLAVAGPCHAYRRLLYDFILEEFQAREPLCPHRLGPICRLLENQRDDLLAFAVALDKELEQAGEEFGVSAGSLRQLLRALGRDDRDPRREAEESVLRRRLGGRYTAIRDAVEAIARGTIRASSLVENVNSRLRGYFFLRRHLGADYLTLLQFFLNHRRLERSERPERVGKTPAELLTGRPHRHWLEMLGYTRFRREAKPAA